MENSPSQSKDAPAPTRPQPSPEPSIASVPVVEKAPGRKRKGRGQSPVVVDTVLASVLPQAVPLLSDLGFYGVASLLNSTNASRQQFSQLLSPQNVQSAVNKTLQDSPPWIHWSKLDCAPAPDVVVQGNHRLIMKSKWGYRMGRATAGTSPAFQGNHLVCRYYELILLKGPTPQEISDNLPPNARLGPGLQAKLDQALSNKRLKTEVSKDENEAVEQVGGHVRAGWSMRTGDLQAPVGYDQWSYGIRSLDGSLLHKSQRLESWGVAEGFEAGDVIGCAILLDQHVPSNNHVRFFKNGQSLGEIVLVKGKRSGGEAFSEIDSGTYYPAASGYLGGGVRANFGPHWICPPRKLPAGTKMQPLDAPTVPSASNNPKVATILKLFRSDQQKQQLQEALELESSILSKALTSFQEEHTEHIRQERLDRDLSVQDLPSPESKENS